MSVTRAILLVVRRWDTGSVGGRLFKRARFRIPLAVAELTKNLADDNVS